MGTAHEKCPKWTTAEIKLDATLNPDSLLLLPQLYEYCVSKRVSRLYWIFLHSTDRSDLSVQWKAKLMSQGINAECDTPALTCQVCISNNTLHTRPRCQISALERDMDCPPSFIIDASEADACKGQRPLSHFVKTPSEWTRTLLRRNL